MKYAVYTLATGAIVRYGSVPDSATAALQTGGNVLLGYVTAADTVEFNDATHYIVATVITAKLTFANFNQLGINANGTSLAQVTGLPNPTVVHIISSNNQVVPATSYTVTDGVFTLNTDTPAVFTVDLTAFPYVRKSVTITAT